MEVIRYAGFTEETTFAQTPPAAVICVDEASASLDAASDSQVIYSGALGLSRRVHRPGFYSCEGDLEYGFDVRSIGWILKWALGGYAFSGSSPYRHEIFGNDERFLPTFCTRLGKDKIDDTDFEHVFSGCAIDSLTLEIKDEYATAKIGIKASKDSKAAIMARSAVEALLPAEYPLVFHEVTVSRDNSDITAKVKGLKLEIKNGVKAESGRSLGSRFARRMPRGGREVSFSLDMYYADTDTLELLWGGASAPANVGSTEVPMTINFDSGVYGSLALALPRVIFTKVPLPIKGQDEIEMAAECAAFEDAVLLNDGVTTVNTEILATVLNDQAEMTTGGS